MDRLKHITEAAALLAQREQDERFLEAALADAAKMRGKALHDFNEAVQAVRNEAKHEVAINSGR